MRVRNGNEPKLSGELKGKLPTAKQLADIVRAEKERCEEGHPRESYQLSKIT